MADLTDELNEITRTMEDLLTLARENDFYETLERLNQAAIKIKASASRSWFGYHANVYLKDFQPPSRGEYFSRKYGLYERSPFGQASPGSWRAYEPEVVMRTIKQGAGNPDLDALTSYNQQAGDEYQKQQKIMLSIIDIELRDSPSEFLSQMRQEAEKATFLDENHFLRNWAPKEFKTRDRTAIQQGILYPCYATVLATVASFRNTLEAVTDLGENAKQTASQIARQRQRRRHDGFIGTKVFIGHGHSPAWRELQDFLQNRLSLSTDEFNRVSAAGIPTSDRLSAMMDTAGIAFLMMTGEDEQADGSLRARENVVHEAGLFQGRLGFGKAIVLLEEGCKEFSNITGLGHIPFPNNSIAAAFEEVRKVLEREGLIGQ